MILTKYRVAGPVKTRYVRKSAIHDFYEWCEQSAKDTRYDLAQGTCEAEDLPEAIRQKCDEMHGKTWGTYACEWPL